MYKMTLFYIDVLQWIKFYAFHPSKDEYFAKGAIFNANVAHDRKFVYVPSTTQNAPNRSLLLKLSLSMQSTWTEKVILALFDM